MGLIILFLVICGCISGLCYWNSKEEDKKENAIAGYLISLGISTVVMCIVWLISYIGYMDMQKNLATIEQYESAVQLYAEKGVAEFKPGNGMPSEFTDLKYQNYQGQIGQMIIDLRNRITSYNKEFVGKKIMKENWFWSWCIVMPDDGKVLKMKDYLK